MMTIAEGSPGHVGATGVQLPETMDDHDPPLGDEASTRQATLGEPLKPLLHTPTQLLPAAVEAQLLGKDPLGRVTEGVPRHTVGAAGVQDPVTLVDHRAPLGALGSATQATAGVPAKPALHTAVQLPPAAVDAHVLGKKPSVMEDGGVPTQAGEPFTQPPEAVAAQDAPVVD